MKDDYLHLVERPPLAPIRNRRQLREAHTMIDELTRIPERKLTSGQADYLEVLGDLALKFEGPQMAHELEKISGLANGLDYRRKLFCGDARLSKRNMFAALHGKT